MNDMLKIISLLLSYPTHELKQSVPELQEVLENSNLSNRQKDSLGKLVSDIAVTDIYDAQERYVFLFDRTRSLSLHLFEHVHGESRDRGQAMVDLMAMYENDGFEIDAKELPDYLPLFLEYLSQKPQVEAIELLGQIAHITVALKERLKKRESIYVHVFGVLAELTKKKPEPGLLSELLAQPEDDPDDLDALDQIWEEEVVTFGGNAGEGSCGPDKLRTQLRASKRKPSRASANPLEG